MKTVHASGNIEEGWYTLGYVFMGHDERRN
jgi:hypothetical protein